MSGLGKALWMPWHLNQEWVGIYQMGKWQKSMGPARAQHKSVCREVVSVHVAKPQGAPMGKRAKIKLGNRWDKYSSNFKELDFKNNRLLSSTFKKGKDYPLVMVPSFIRAVFKPISIFQ